MVPIVIICNDIDEINKKIKEINNTYGEDITIDICITPIVKKELKNTVKVEGCNNEVTTTEYSYKYLVEFYIDEAEI